MKITDTDVLTYLRTNIPLYSKEALIEQVRKAGYTTEDISETIDSLLKPQPAEQTKQSDPTPVVHVDNSLAYNKPLPTNVFAKSWFLFSQSLKILQRDKELFAYTLLASILNIIFFGLFIIPFLIAGVMEYFFGAVGMVGTYALIFLFYFGGAVITTFFNTAIVHVVQKRLEGGDPNFSDGFTFALKRMPRILQWSLITATLGLIIRIIENLAERLPIVGEIVVLIITNLLGLAWSIITIFAIPAMVIQDISPWSAIKESGKTLQQTFGRYFIASMGMGLMFIGIMVCGIVITIALVVLSFVLSLPAFVPLLIGLLLFIFMVVVVMVFSTLNQIFRTAVYLYAAKGIVAPEFGEDALKSAFKPKKKGLFTKGA